MRERILIIGGCNASMLASISAAACFGDRDIAAIIDDPPRPKVDMEELARKVADYAICASSMDYEKDFDARGPRNNEPFYRSLPKYRKRRK